MKLFGSLILAAAAAIAAPRPDLLVSTEWLAQHLNDAKLVVLDVGNGRTNERARIPGARLVVIQDFTTERDGVDFELRPVADLKKILDAAGVSNDSRVIVYSDGNVLMATRVYFTMDYLGHGEHTALLDGGMEKWRAEGRPLVNDSRDVSPSNFVPRLRPEAVVAIDTVKSLTKASPGGPVLLDVRSQGEFRAGRGHIPGALNVPWMQTMRQDQTLRPIGELAALYEAAGITPDRPVVPYCYIGMQASQSYFTLKYLGYDVRLYDGSLTEWIAKGSPVEK